MTKQERSKIFYDSYGDLRFGWIIALIIGGLCLVIIIPIMYLETLTNYNSLPYYDKYCHLDMSQTWNNAWKLNFIDLHWCNYNNVDLNK